MRALHRLLLPALCLGVVGCVPENVLPADPDWREKVTDAINSTPGLSRSEVVINDIDSGIGHVAPLLRATFAVADSADPQTVVDAVVANMCSVLGKGTEGIGVRFFITARGKHALRPSDFGYEGHVLASHFCG